MPAAPSPTAAAPSAPRGGLIAGLATLIEFVFAPPAIALAIGAYLNVQFPGLDPKHAAVGAYFIFMTLNILGVSIAATFELVVTVLAVAELLVFMGVVAPGFSFSNFALNGWSGASEFSSASIAGIFAAIPFAIWFFLAIEGAAMAAEEAKDPKRTIPRAYISGILTLVLLALSAESVPSSRVLRGVLAELGVDQGLLGHDLLAEIVAPGEALRPGAVYDSNAAIIGAAVENDIAGIVLDRLDRHQLRTIAIVAILQPAHIAAQLLFDTVGRALERDMRVLRLAVPLQHQPLHHMRDDVALETVVRTLAEGRVRADRAREIFVGNRVHPVRDMRLQRFAGFDLVARDADFHFSSPSWPAR